MAFVTWSDEERTLLKSRALQIFQSDEWASNFFDAVKAAMVQVLPPSRHRKLVGTWHVYWMHPALPNGTARTAEALEACADMHLKKRDTAKDSVEKLVEFFSTAHSTIVTYRNWRMAQDANIHVCAECLLEQAVDSLSNEQRALRLCRTCCMLSGVSYPSSVELQTVKAEESDAVDFLEDEDGNSKEDFGVVKSTDSSPVQMEEVVEDGVEYMVCTVKIPKPAAQSDVSEALAKLTVLVEESKAVALGNKLLLEALPTRISAALNPLSLNIVNLIDAVRALSDATGTVGNLEVPAAPPVQSTVKAKKPSILVVGLLPQQAQEIRSSFGEVFDLRFIESHVSNVEQLIRNTDQIYGNTKFMKHSLDAVLRKVGADRYTRFSGSTSKLKVLLRRQNSSYLGLEM